MSAKNKIEKLPPSIIKRDFNAFKSFFGLSNDEWMGLFVLAIVILSTIAATSYYHVYENSKAERFSEADIEYILWVNEVCDRMPEKPQYRACVMDALVGSGVWR